MRISRTALSAVRELKTTYFAFFKLASQVASVFRSSGVPVQAFICGLSCNFSCFVRYFSTHSAVWVEPRSERSGAFEEASVILICWDSIEWHVLHLLSMKRVLPSFLAAS